MLLVLPALLVLPRGDASDSGFTLALRS